MRAYVLEGNRDVRIENIGKPEIKAGEALVKVAAAGICGSDIPRMYHGGAYHYPLITGHEFAGRVESVADDTDRSLVGKRVCVFPLIPCGKCPQCQNKHYELCANYSYAGSRQDGGFAEFVAMPTWNLLELPDNVSFEQAAMMEPMCVAVHAIRRVSISAEDKIVVSGMGTIGLLVLVFLLERGYENVYAIGNKDIQKKAAVSLGLCADHFYDLRVNKQDQNVDNTASQSASEWITSVTDGHGADVFFECAGQQSSTLLAIESAAYLGKIVFTGNAATDTLIDKKLYSYILRHELTVTGTWNSSFTREVDDDWHYVLERLSSGRVHPEKLISHQYDFDDLIQGFELMRDKREEYIKEMGIFE